jgi:polyphenol oxidase
MPTQSKNSISFFTFPNIDEFGLTHGVFMRRGGCSPNPWESLNLATSVGDDRESVIENRRRITNVLSVEEDSIYDVWQVHSNKVISTNRPRPLEESHKKADAIISNNPHVTLLMLFADCVPVLFYDPENSVAAIAHAGWQGTLNGVVVETVFKMKKEYKTDPEKLIVGIGPSICMNHYEIGKDLEGKFLKKINPKENILNYSRGKIFLDLRRANEILLMNIGVVNIINSNICTACNVGDWYSHRAENGVTGRFAAVITVNKKN